MTAQLLTHKFTTQQYHLMHEAGVFAQGERLELIDGEIKKMSPIGRKHAACVNRLVTIFTKKLGDLIILSVQNPIRLADNSEPQPDLAILKLRADFYEEELPTPSDILLIVEVVDSTIAYDREVKAPLYASVGIPEMWLFDVNKKAIEGYSQPSASGYKQLNRYEKNDKLSILAFPEVMFTWEELF